MARDTTLIDYLEIYFLERDLAQRSQQTMRYSVARFERWLGHQAFLSDFTDDSVNRFLLALSADGNARATIRTRRTDMLCLWRAAWQSGMMLLPPQRVRKINVPRKMPDAWTHDEMEAIVAGCRKLDGQLRFFPLRKRDFYNAFIRVKYDTGLRLTDMHELRKDQLSESCKFAVTQHKTGDVVLCQMWPQTMAALGPVIAATVEHPLLFGYLDPRQMQLDFAKLLKIVGLKGSLHKIRRTGATAMEMQKPGSAQLFLGHRTPGLAHKSYIDQRITQTEKQLPPRLMVV